MPTQQTTYNSRLTDEALEKKFRDTFKSQGGAELVDDLYAQGVIVPIVDFTAAAQGSELRSDLQSAWDAGTGLDTIANANQVLVSTPGFWKVDLVASILFSSGATRNCRVFIDDGTTETNVWKTSSASTAADDVTSTTEDTFTVFLRSGDSLKAASNNSLAILNVWYRQIADVSGNLVNPLGFTSS